MLVEVGGWVGVGGCGWVGAPGLVAFWGSPYYRLKYERTEGFFENQRTQRIRVFLGHRTLILAIFLKRFKRFSQKKA